MTEKHTTHDDAHDDGSHGVGHVVSPTILIATAVGLVILTAITVTSAQFDWAEIDLPEMNIWIAMIIAAAKASLVCLFFMHLFWDRAFNAIIIVVSLGFVGIFIAFSLTDTVAYRPEIVPGDSAQVQQELSSLAEAERAAEAEGGAHD